MHILVTGGAGYIGSGLLVKLGKDFPEATITSIDNLERGDYSYIRFLEKDKRYNLFVGDIRKKSDVMSTRRTDAPLFYLYSVIRIDTPG